MATIKKTVTITVSRVSSTARRAVASLRHTMARERLYRFGTAALAALFIFAFVADTIVLKQRSDKYNLSRVEGVLLNEPIDLYNQKLVIDVANNRLVYNEGYQPASSVAGFSSAPKFSAVFDSGSERSVEVIDAVNQVSFKMKPKFRLDTPQKNMNRVVYPIVGKNATKVFTLQGSAIKEDIILFEYQGDEMTFDYELELPAGTEARMENDGSVGVYSISPELMGNISVGSEGDQELLEKMRNAQQKNVLLFSIPAPFIVESNKKVSSKARAWFSIPDKKTLRVYATGLKDISYPASIDPSVYIETARKLMRGNNETNVDFDVTNELIQKGSTTGARFDSWDTTTQLNDGRWNGASAVAGGFIYYAGGSTQGGLVETPFSTPGTTTYVVPAGVTSVTIKAWGAGGGGGGASADRAGGAGGGGGYSSSTIAVTPGESLSVRIGGGGGGGTGNGSGTNSGNGGGGGGYSGVYRSATALIVAAGGGGGGGGNGDTASTARQPGSVGGPGGGTTGVAGSGNGTTTGGGGGTQSAGGGGGIASGASGASLTGGAGGSNGANQVNGGTTGGGNGGTQQNGGGPNKKPGGGGGGAGFFGGGGGGLADSQYNGGGGGGGGSSYTTGSPATNAAGVGQNPGNISDPDRNGAGGGGGGGTTGGDGIPGNNGYLIIRYATGGAGAVQDEVYWAQLNENTGSVTSPNPGNGTCVNWCTSLAYNLPAERQGHAMVAYNGFLYVIGGENGSGTHQTTVYIAKLGANGEPQLWHPTDTNKNNWVYWFAGTSLSSARSYHSITVYNNRLYILGGRNSSNPGGITTVEAAAIAPTGELGSWSTTGMTALPSARFAHSVQVYNDYIYLIGGNSGGTLQNSVHYGRIGADGSIGTWFTTSAFSGSRMSWGGKNSTVWGGYLYLHGGCTAINGTTGYCTTAAQDTQIASINADGTLTEWNTIVGLNAIRFGHSVETWRNRIYGLGGCKAQNPIDGNCLDLILTNSFGKINQDGDASTVSDSQPSGSGNCTGSDPYDCDTPPLGNSDGEGGQMAGGVVINNGYVYYIGGCRVVGGSNQICTNGAASRTADTIYYAQIANDGTLRRPTVCTGTGRTYAGSWCVDNFNTINGSVGLAAFGYAVFNNTMYVIGGTDGATWQTNVYYTTLNVNGTLNAWSSQAQSTVGLGAASIGYPYVFTRANPSSAGTFPGNLYVIGGCNGTGAGIDCNNTFFTTVYKCKITTSGALGTGGDACTTTGQVQLDAEPLTSGNQGLGIMAGTVYANYIYLIGGQSPNQEERGQVMYARIDNNNDIVDVDDETINDNIWETASSSINPSRRRGIAFGYNGYLYALAGFAVDTGLNDLLFAKIDVSNGNIGAFTTSGVTVNQRWDLRGVVSSGYVYTLGGCSSGAPPATCNAMTATVQTFQLYNNFSGSTGDYISSANDFATDRIGGSAAVLNGYLYVAGGCTSATDCTATTTSVQYALLGADGSIGTWSAATAGLPAARAWGQLETVGGQLYYLGGQSGADSTAQSAIYYALPTSGGDVTAWSTASGGIGDTASQAAQSRTEFGAAVWNNRIYVVGGFSGSAVTNTVFISPNLSSGGNIAADSWTSDGDVFAVARRGATVMAYAGNLYIMGGFDGTNYLNDVQYTQINSDGSIDPWSFTTSLPQRVRNADGFAVNGYMYVFGGRSAATTCTTNTYISPISANTTIASGNNPTGVGEWYQTREALDGSTRYGAAAAYNQGKAYILGGGCGATLTYTGADRTLYATLFSQPQTARYSRMIDTDTDVFPTKWLMNGLDNDIGARWVMSYRSSTGTNNAWGQLTNFGTVTLGNVENYIPLDGSGTNTNFARFYYFSIAIDSSRAYGYPDDVTRGPTIDDLTLFFTSDPSKRLRHGKTFTGGEKQPLDTPPGN
jgi:hypothetical protein